MTCKKKKPMLVYLREDQFETLRAVAERRGESIAALVREGVDLLLDGLPPSEDALLDVVGLYDSGRGDLSEKHDEHLVSMVKDESSHEP
jgi:hypothetical protein